MNRRFYNRSLKAGREGKKGKAVAGLTAAPDVLREAESAWTSLSEVRRKMRRSLMYAYEDQWGDVIREPDTDKPVTEGRYIMKQGKVPLKNNMIRPIIKNVDGQFRQNQTRPVCVVRDQKEAKLGEMMSIAIEYVHQLNECMELDADSLNMLMLSGICTQRIEYGFNPAKQNRDVWIYGVNPHRLFFNTNLEDVRAWDLNLIGEIYDLPLSDVVAYFAKSKTQRDAILSIYGERLPNYYMGNDGMQGEQNRNMTFRSPSRPDLCRVVLVWKKESRECYFCNDNLTGEWWYSPFSDKGTIDAINTQRMEEALMNGVQEEDVLLIEYEWSVEQYWYYRYMTPMGDVLQEGRSPYWHKEHNYILHLYPMVQGKIFNFVEDFIDQQRAINRTMTLIDFIRGASSKGVLIADEDVLSSMTKEELVDEYVRYNGVIFVRVPQGKSIDGVIRQYSGNVSVAGDYELLNLQLKLINDISGVNSAMQGRPAASGTPASLYAQQIQNSSLNLKGLMDSFKSFRLRRDNKVMKTIQQFYTSARHIELAGSDYSQEAKWYNPEKVMHAEIDVSITDGANTPMYQMLINDFLMELFRANAIGIKQVLENSTFPFASRILESIKREEEAMQQAQLSGQVPNVQGVDPNLVQQVQGKANPEAMQRINKALAA